MKNIVLKTTNDKLQTVRIFCSGIGGIGLSAYASLQRTAGHEVFGSDRSDSALLQSLRAQGIAISLKQDGSAIPDGCDLFVYSEAIAADAPERRAARERGIRSISYFHALGELSAGKTVIAVCGTHGKSSTTAMAAKVLIDAAKDPTVVVGTKVPDLGGTNVRSGSSDLFLLEACEYRCSFHYLSPSIALLTTVDGDHFDAFTDLADYQEAFVDFFKGLPKTGVIVLHGSDADAVRIAHESGRTIIDADVFPLPTLGIPGEHMRSNARLVIALAHHVGIPDASACASLRSFQGTWRRMEVKGDRDGITIIDDYGHHPLEIRATLRAMRGAFPGRRIVCVFQPHTHDRTLKLYDDFCMAFTDADIVVVSNVYDARHEIETATVDVTRFVEDLEKGSGVTTIDGCSLEHTEFLLRDSILVSGDVLVCMGAGDVTMLANKMAS